MNCDGQWAQTADNDDLVLK